MNPNEQRRQEATAMREKFLDEMAEHLGEHFPVGKRVWIRLHKGMPRPTEFEIYQISTYRCVNPYLWLRNVKTKKTRSKQFSRIQFEEPELYEAPNIPTTAPLFGWGLSDAPIQ